MHWELNSTCSLESRPGDVEFSVTPETQGSRERKSIRMRNVLRGHDVTRVRRMAHQRIEAVRKGSGKVDTFSCQINEENRQELDLREADLREIPESVIELVLQGLKVLKLCTDHIDSLPQSISMLDELEELFLHTSNYERMTF